MAKQTFTTGQVLTAQEMTSLQQTALGGGATTAKTSSYVLVAADAGTVVQMNAAGATTITVNTALFSAGDTVQIQNVGAGVCTVTAGTATVSTAGSLALSQYEAGELYFNTTSAALFFDIVQTSGMTNPMTTTGDIIYSSSGSTPARLGIGTTGQVVTVASGLPSWSTPAGAGTKIGQVVQTFLSTTFSTASASYTDLTGLSVSITPTLNTSKILIFVSVTEGTSTGTAGNNFLQLLRGATAIGNSTGVSLPSFSALAATMMPTAGSIDSNCVFLDSPATTSSTTYKIQIKNDGGYTAYINRRGADTNSGGVSTITVMEVVV